MTGIPPIISIVTPSYNRVDDLEHLYTSLKEQTIDKGLFELIVSDDGSIDTTEEMVKKWQADPSYSGVIPHCHWRDKALASLATMSMVRRQLRRLGNDLTTIRQPSALWSLVLDMLHRKRMTKRYLKEQG